MVQNGVSSRTNNDAENDYDDHYDYISTQAGIKHTTSINLFKSLTIWLIDDDF